MSSETETYDVEVVDTRLHPAIPLQDRNSITKLWNVINSGKPYAEVLEFIQNEIEESTRVISFKYEINCFLSDGAYALSRAVEGKVGFAKQDNSGPSGRPPEMIDITFADGTHKKVPYGKIFLPAFGEKSFVDMSYDSENQVLHVKGQCQKRYVSDLDNIIDVTNRILKNDSIYRGQAIKFVADEEPEFIDLSSIDKTALYLTPEAQFATEPIEARIEKTDECIKNNIDIKFGVLLEGTYGTGKTLYAFKLARKAVQNGWTFVYCKNAEDSLDAMKMAQRYCGNGRGVVLFIEDIDKVLDKRDEYTNEISLLMDGGESKNINLITVFTTNHIEKIEPTFLRGKRIGSIVTLTHPDKETAKTMLIKLLVDDRGNTLVDGDVDNAAQRIVDLEIVPAFIAEIIDKVKTHILFSGKEKVTEQDILNAIMAYQRQMEIAKLREEQPSVGDRLANNLKELLTAPSKEETEILNDIQEKVEYIWNQH